MTSKGVNLQGAKTAKVLVNTTLPPLVRLRNNSSSVIVLGLEPFNQRRQSVASPETYKHYQFILPLIGFRDLLEKSREV